MKAYQYLAIVLLFVIPSCVTKKGNKPWPARTKDPKILLDNSPKLSSQDIDQIHKLVWSKDPNARIFALATSGAGTTIANLSYISGNRFKLTKGYELTKQSGEWKFTGRWDIMRVMPDGSVNSQSY